MLTLPACVLTLGNTSPLISLPRKSNQRIWGSPFWRFVGAVSHSKIPSALHCTWSTNTHRNWLKVTEGRDRRTHFMGIFRLWLWGGFGSERVNFLHSSFYGVVLDCAENSFDIYRDVLVTVPGESRALLSWGKKEDGGSIWSDRFCLPTPNGARLSWGWLSPACPWEVGMNFLLFFACMCDFRLWVCHGFPHFYTYSLPFQPEESE